MGTFLNRCTTKAAALESPYCGRSYLCHSYQSLLLVSKTLQSPRFSRLIPCRWQCLKSTRGSACFTMQSLHSFTKTSNAFSCVAMDPSTRAAEEESAGRGPVSSESTFSDADCYACIWSVPGQSNWKSKAGQSNRKTLPAGPLQISCIRRASSLLSSRAWNISEVQGFTDPAVAISTVLCCKMTETFFTHLSTWALF